MNALANAFSLQMLEISDRVVVSISPAKVEDIPTDVASYIGHADTAAVVSSLLGREIPCNRGNLKLSAGDVLYVAQLQGGRLPEGSTTLPEGFGIAFYKVVLAKTDRLSIGDGSLPVFLEDFFWSAGR